MMEGATVIHISFQDIAGRGIDANRIRTDQASRDEEARERAPYRRMVPFPLADPVADGFYAETVNTATTGHWDLIKIMTCGNYMPVAYGADYEFSTNPQKWDGVFHSHPITSAVDAGKLGVLDATNDTLAQNDGGALIFGPGCTLPLDVDRSLFSLIYEVVHEAGLR